MSQEAQLEKALTKLRKQGEDIGAPSTYDGKKVIPVGGVLMTLEQIFQLTEISPEA